MIKNKIQELLCSLNICDESSIKPFFPKVRDRDDVAVLKCQKSGVIFLSRSDHMKISHYENCNDLKYWADGDRPAALAVTLADDKRRSDQFRAMISGKVWLDVGTGLGGILDLLKTDAAKILAVEPQAGARESLQKNGYTVYTTLKEVHRKNIDIVTLFHVLEHLTEPIETLRDIKQLIKPGGKIIIEVPHANDILLSSFESEAFKAFTLWSEHLILHTRQSLMVFLEKAGFINITVSGFQRYPLANHLYWLTKGKPGGQNVWPQLRDLKLDNAYEKLLDRNNQTDTLIAIADVKKN